MAVMARFIAPDATSNVSSLKLDLKPIINYEPGPQNNQRHLRIFHCALSSLATALKHCYTEAASSPSRTPLNLQPGSICGPTRSPRPCRAVTATGRDCLLVELLLLGHPSPKASASCDLSTFATQDSPLAMAGTHACRRPADQVLDWRTVALAALALPLKASASLGAKRLLCRPCRL